jgi:CRP-like cAMP-binding protein
VTATTHPGLSPFVRKLERLGPLADEDRRALEALPLRVRRVDVDGDLVREGDRPSHCLLLLDGFACRHKTLDDGRRQIVSFHIAGDIMDLSGLLLGRMDHGITALTPVEVAPVPSATVLDWAERRPGLNRLLWRDALIDASIFREWVLNVGRRSARERVAHVVCELVARSLSAGLVPDYRCELPVTRADLADATGLTVVHANRVVQEMRAEGLVEVRGRTLAVVDWRGLTRAAGFDPAYLHPFAAAA